MYENNINDNHKNYNEYHNFYYGGLYELTYGNGVYVSVGNLDWDSNKGDNLYTNNLRNWEKRRLTNSSILTSIIYTNDLQ